MKAPWKHKTLPRRAMLEVDTRLVAEPLPADRPIEWLPPPRQQETTTMRTLTLLSVEERVLASGSEYFRFRFETNDGYLVWDHVSARVEAIWRANQYVQAFTVFQETGHRRGWLTIEDLETWVGCQVEAKLKWSERPFGHWSIDRLYPVRR